MKKLSRNEMKKLQGGGPPEDPIGFDCSITCNSGYFACCTGGLCACFTNDQQGATCDKGGKGSSTCSS